MLRQTTRFCFPIVAAAALVLFPALAHAENTRPARGLLSGAGLDNGNSLVLLADPTEINDLGLQGNTSFKTPGFSAIENLTWRSTVPGTQVAAGLYVLDLGDQPPNPQLELKIRTIELQEVALQVTPINPSSIATGSVQLDFRDVDVGDPVRITMESSSAELPVAPLWWGDSVMTLHSKTGSNTVTELSGNRSPIALDVDSGTSLTFYGCGQLGGNEDDSTRLNFYLAGNSGDVDNGILDIDRSHVIFAGDIRAYNGGELKVTGADSVLDIRERNGQSADLELDTATLTMGQSGTTLLAETMTLTGATTISQASGSQVLISSTVDLLAGATSTMTFSGSSFTDGTLFQTDSLLMRDSTMTVGGGFGTVSLPTLDMGGTTGSTLQINGENRLVITAPTGSFVSEFRSGSLIIDTPAAMTIESGGIVNSSIDITNNGDITVEGTLKATASIGGTGQTLVQPNGTLEILGLSGNEALTFNQGLQLNGLSTLKLDINATSKTSQQLITTDTLSIGVGTLADTYLDVFVMADVALPEGTVFPLIDYNGADPILGFFRTTGGNRITEGEVLSLGLNHYRFSYADSVYSPSDPSVMTLTVVPEPSTLFLGLCGIGFAMWRRSKISGRSAERT